MYILLAFLLGVWVHHRWVRWLRATVLLVAIQAATDLIKQQLHPDAAAIERLIKETQT